MTMLLSQSSDQGPAASASSGNGGASGRRCSSRNSASRAAATLAPVLNTSNVIGLLRMGSPWVRLRRADITRVERSLAAGGRAAIRESDYSEAPGTLIA